MSRISDLVVVTGGIGSGKSVVLTLLRALEWTVIDADAVARRALDSMVDLVAELWPGAVTGAAIDRSILARAVFSDVDELRKLESLVYPTVRMELAAWLRGASLPAAVEISSPSYPVSSESLLVVVDAPNELRRSRVIGRAMDPEDFERRIRLQPSRTDWLARATVVLDNGGDSERTGRAVREFDRWWRAQ